MRDDMHAADINFSSREAPFQWLRDLSRQFINSAFVTTAREQYAEGVGSSKNIFRRQGGYVPILLETRWKLSISPFPHINSVKYIFRSDWNSVTDFFLFFLPRRQWCEYFGGEIEGWVVRNIWKFLPFYI